MPDWHVSTDEVIANNNEKPSQVYITYNPNRFVGFANIFTTNNKDVHFIMGPKVKKYHKEGNLWFR